MVVSRKQSGRGHKISKVKRNNQRRTKLIKHGKLKMKRNKRATDIRRKPARQPPPDPVPEDEGSEQEDMSSMVEADDLNFLQHAANTKAYSMLKRVRLTEGQSEEQEEVALGPKKRRASDWPEAQYERQLEVEMAQMQPTRELLPIKTKDGQVQRRTTTEELKRLKDVVKTEDTEVVDEEKQEEEEEELEKAAEEVEARLGLDLSSGPVTTAQLLAARRRRLEILQLSIGNLASGALEDPVHKLGNVKKLLQLMTGPQSPEISLTAPRLAAVSLLEVFRDVLPEYPIKHVAQEGVKLRKETVELRTEESALLSVYRGYLAGLEKMLRPLASKQAKQGYNKGSKCCPLALTALKCLGSLLEARPSFNFSTNLVRLLVPLLDVPSPEARGVASASLSNVLKQDKRGEISLEVARRVGMLVRGRGERVRPDAVLLLLSLRLRDVDLDKSREVEVRQKKLKGKKSKMLAAVASKRERKRAKRMAELNKELLETQAEEDRSLRQRNFTEAAKIAFAIFFRVLKSRPSAPLLAAALQGLSKFAHCLNVEVYSDLINSLENLLGKPSGSADEEQEAGLPLRLRLLCVQTLLAVVSGHGQFLAIDPARFHSHLYRSLLPLCAAGGKDDHVRAALEPLTGVLVTRRRSLSQARALAFTKRLGTLSLSLPHHSALAFLQLAKQSLQLGRSLSTLLEPGEGGGGWQGRYLPLLEEPEHCNADSTALFELALLQRHFHPTVAELAKHVARGAPPPGETNWSPDLDRKSAEELMSEFDPSLGMFRPTVPSPSAHRPRARLALNISCPQLREEAARLLESDDGEPPDFFAELGVARG